MLIWVNHSNIAGHVRRVSSKVEALTSANVLTGNLEALEHAGYPPTRSVVRYKNLVRVVCLCHDSHGKNFST